MNTFIVTGASDGIGAEIARQLARRHGAGVTKLIAPGLVEKMALAGLNDDCKKL